MDIQVDPRILVVNLENCMPEQANQQMAKGECMYTSTQPLLKGECMYTVAVTTGEDATMVQIPVSVHCAGDVQQAFGTLTQLRPHQQYDQVEETPLYPQIEMAEDLQCLVADNQETPSNENSCENGTSETQQLEHNVEQQEPSDPNSSYYTDIFNYLTSKSAPVGATMSHKMMLKSRAKNYRIVDGRLYYWHNKPKIVVTKLSDQLAIMQKTHVERETGVHLGVRKMYMAINSTCYWRGQYVDVANFVRQCDKCTEVGESRSPTSILQKSLSENGEEEDEETVDDPLPESDKVWQKVEVNLYGPYPKTVEHNEYLITVIDPVSRWMVAQPIPDVNLPSNIASFVHKTLCTFGFARCHVGKMLGQLFESVCMCYQQLLNNMQEVLSRLGFPSNLPASKTLLTLQDGEGEGKCAWAHALLDYFVNGNPATWDSEVTKFLFEFHTMARDSVSTPYFNMFGRKPNRYGDEDKENINAGAEQNDTDITFKRRRLQSSVLQCRHCEEMFTSKISFRIHQRKHTEEARRRGMLEGQEPTRIVINREKKQLRRVGLKRKQQRLTKLHGSLEHESRLAPLAAQNAIGLDQQRWTDGCRAELRANTVAAVKRILARTKETRRRRGKYKKFSTEVQEEMARYAIEHGTLMAVRVFSEKLGVVVSESTIRNIVKWYQCFTPEVKEEIGRFAAAYGIEATATHFSERLGREVRHGLIRKFKKLYLYRYPDAKRQGNKSKGTQFDANNVVASSDRPKRNNKYTAELKEEIGQYACEHSIPLTVKHISQKHNIILKESMVRKCRKLYSDKHQSSQEKQKQQEQEHHLEQHQQQLPLQQQQQQHQQEQQQHHFLGRLLQQHLQQGQPSSVQESIDPSSNTIDILQTSLNLLNNPQLNSSATVVYNHAYQNTSVPQLQTSKHISTIHEQQNPPITFQAITQCSDSTVPTSMPVAYQHQQVPISASVIMNPSITTVQTFQPAQVYPTFNHQGQPIQAASLSVPGNTSISLAIAQSTPQQATPQHSTLPTITVAVGPPHSQQQFQQATNSPAVVVSQAVPQHPILVPHSQAGTTLMHQLIASQTHQTHFSHQIINNSTAENNETYTHVLDQHHDLNTDAFSHALDSNITALPFDPSTPTTLVRDRVGNYILQTAVECRETTGLTKTEEPDSILPDVASNENDNEVTITIVRNSDAKEGSLSDPELTKQQMPVADEVDVSLSGCSSTGKTLKGKGGGKGKGKIQRKRGGTKRNRSSAKKSGQKRGNYTMYSPEIRAEIGKYAAQFGSQKACYHFITILGHEIPESTVRGLRDKYLLKREKCDKVEKEVTSLGYAPRGRPMRLGKYDGVVQECILELVKAGERISSFLAIATARQVLEQNEPHLLEENGGNIKLSITWAKSFLKRIGIKNYS